MAWQDQPPAYPEEYGDHLVAGMAALGHAVLGLCFLAALGTPLAVLVAHALPLFLR